MQKGKTVKVAYKEPSNYIPKAIRKKYGLGEYAEDEDKAKETKETKKTKKTK